MSLSAVLSWVILNVHKFLIFFNCKMNGMTFFIFQFLFRIMKENFGRRLFLFAQSVVLPVKRQQDNLPLTHAPPAMSTHLSRR